MQAKLILKFIINYKIPTLYTDKIKHNLIQTNDYLNLINKLGYKYLAIFQIYCDHT